MRTLRSELIGRAIALGAAVVLGSSLCAPAAHATYIVTLAEQGANVVATGSGSFNLTGLTMSNSGVSIISAIIPNNGAINTGPISGVLEDVYSGFTGPTTFGSKGITFADLGGGDAVGINGSAGNLYVPMGYTSGQSLTDTSTYLNQTYGGLGVTPGATYTWTWGPATDDSFVLQVSTAVPELPVFAYFGIGLIGLAVVGVRRRAQT
jgi:hypothetical protein